MVINSIEIEVERKPIKNLHLAVYPPDGRVHVSAPQTYTDEQIKFFVLKKWVWLVQKRKETTSYTFQDEREYVSGEAHYYKGELYRLKVIRDNTCTFHVEIQGDYINVYVYERTPKENIANVLWNWYKEQLISTIRQYVAKWENILDVKVADWTIQQMQSSWGKCHKDTGKIMFNLQLAKKPLNCIEYVVVHELTHLIEQNHTDKFRNILGTYLPGWQKIKEQYKKEYGKSDFQKRLVRLAIYSIIGFLFSIFLVVYSVVKQQDIMSNLLIAIPLFIAALIFAIGRHYAKLTVLNKIALKEKN